MVFDHTFYFFTSIPIGNANAQTEYFSDLVCVISDFYDVVLVFAYYLSNIVYYDSQCDITLVLTDIISFVQQFSVRFNDKS